MPRGDCWVRDENLPTVDLERSLPSIGVKLPFACRKKYVTN